MSMLVTIVVLKKNENPMKKYIMGVLCVLLTFSVCLAEEESVNDKKKSDANHYRACN